MAPYVTSRKRKIFNFKYTASAIAIAVASTCAFGPSNAFAQESPQASTSEYTVSTDESGWDVLLSVDNGATFETTGDVVQVRDDSGSVIDTLPASTVDSEGEYVGFRYNQVSENEVQVLFTDEYGFVDYGRGRKVAKCVLGTAGSAALGAAAGGGPLGAAGGGAVGVATFCL